MSAFSDPQIHSARRPDRGRPVAVEAAAARGTVLFGALFRDTEERIPGGLLIGSLDVFAGGEPASFLRNLAAHFPDPARNRLVVIPGTGHTYQGKARDAAREIAELVGRWNEE